MTDDVVKMMRYDASKKSVGVAYLLWLVLGGIGLHRFYAGHTLTGVVMLLLQFAGWLTFPVGGIFLLGIVFIWWLIDAFTLPKMIERRNLRLAATIHTGQKF